MKAINAFLKLKDLLDKETITLEDVKTIYKEVLSNIKSYKKKSSIKDLKNYIRIKHAYVPGYLEYDESANWISGIGFTGIDNKLHDISAEHFSSFSAGSIPSLKLVLLDTIERNKRLKIYEITTFNSALTEKKDFLSEVVYHTFLNYSGVYTIDGRYFILYITDDPLVNDLPENTFLSLSDYIKIGFNEKSTLGHACYRKAVDFTKDDDAFYLQQFLDGKCEFSFMFGANRRQLKSSTDLLKCINSSYFNSSHTVPMSGNKFVDKNITTCFKHYSNLLNEEIIYALYDLIHSENYKGYDYRHIHWNDEDFDKFKKKTHELLKSEKGVSLSDDIKLFLEYID